MRVGVRRWFFAILCPAVGFLFMILKFVFGVPRVVHLLFWWPFPSFLPLFLRLCGAHVGQGVTVRRVEFMNMGRTLAGLIIHDGAHIGEGVLMDLTDSVEIGRNAVLAPRVMLFTHQDVGARPLAEKLPRKQAPVIVEEDAYIGAGSILLCGSQVGRGAVVAAGSVVHGKLEPCKVYGGIPCRVIREEI